MFDGTNLNFNHYFIHREGRFLYEKIIYIWISYRRTSR
jgi:hypothetical protein